ncbi:hypothetical protein LOZ39_003405 [Ophidiomyces ophidiicola]|uniref:uncharacterized protein n=1 Tax=Ophidiomyces ophidiicola TaxID=1387563 RepID=UPI0020C2CA17|nr:uncharacterized protein LOZ57_006158 [Ophidiomyces ophidiicola]KAI1939198.1 hypothetical protein LOZ57_006158 [Ophidiomyces ophidiicola]KAI2004893.1 hypothetical protein LOZ49_005669 [Ophidiomyces ophidiicola]KAI2058078.1 hypothetical protein LOZ43_002728 [Ophidiomyces ophidiicola]KAI2075210.1 hypothetical protein LOZ39_003405 [Ophidiomyces ophidiicola]KAI2086777.1 hypothetical protein LOZ36_003110 [Ophidiomyces ophidiicola]
MAFVPDDQPSNLTQIISALQEVQNNAGHLDHEHHRYSDSPPPYSPGETIQIYIPQLPVSREVIEWQRQADLDSSRPREQFLSECVRECKLLVDQIERDDERRKLTLPFDRQLDVDENARNNVMNRWVKQGIWKEGWNCYNFGSRWQHEESPEPEPETESESEPEPQATPAAFSFFGTRAPPEAPTLFEVPRPNKQKRFKPITEQQRADHDRATAASRPYHRFLAQIAFEQEWLKDEMTNFGHHLERVAYKRAKDIWIKQKIWNPNWDDMPGPKWMHEEPEEEDSDDVSSDEPSSTTPGHYHANIIDFGAEQNRTDGGTPPPPSVVARTSAQSSDSTPQGCVSILQAQNNHDQEAANPSLPGLNTVTDERRPHVRFESRIPTRSNNSTSLRSRTGVDSNHRVLRSNRVSKVSKSTRQGRQSIRAQARGSTTNGLADTLGHAESSSKNADQPHNTPYHPPSSQYQDNSKSNTSPSVRRSARIKERVGTSKCTRYDAAPTTLRRSPRNTKPQPNTRSRRETNQIATQTRAPRVTKNRSRKKTGKPGLILAEPKSRQKPKTR